MPPQTPLPAADNKRKFLTPAMLQGLDKIGRIIAVHAELPRGLTAKLMEFMAPFAGISTIRRRLGQDRDVHAGTAEPGATPPTAPDAGESDAVAVPEAPPPPTAPSVAPKVVTSRHTLAPRRRSD